jgi:hypothetical protein
MAKIVEEVVVVKFSRIVKDNEDNTNSIATPDIQTALEQVAQELAGDGVVVEVEKA